MSVTIDCGEGKHEICRGRGRQHYLMPQYDDGEEFECECPCHDGFNRLLEEVMRYCPRCGRRLEQPDEPASCGCGWRENDDGAGAPDHLVG